MSGNEPRKGPPPIQMELPPSAPERPGNLEFVETLRGLASQAENQIDELLINLRLPRITGLQLKRDSRLIVFYSYDMLDHRDAEQFYEILNALKPTKNLDLMILTPGGSSAAAFKISRMCQDYTEKTQGKFCVIVPYYAKSAGTILALGADSIIMGPPSELGPIDPQHLDQQHGQGYVPLLALRDALSYIESRVSTDPNLAAMYWPLVKEAGIRSIGYYDREVESSKQYAKILLENRMMRDHPERAIEISTKLVDYYKNHGHVIDRIEAEKQLGLVIEQPDLEQWQLMWQLHETYDFIIRRELLKQRSIKIMETDTVREVRVIQIPQKAMKNYTEIDQLAKGGGITLG